MPLEWTHDHKCCAEVPCTRDTECAGFPTMVDRVDMARAAFGEYSEADADSATDFFMDVALFMFSEMAKARSDSEQIRLQLYHLVDRAEIEWREEAVRIGGHWTKDNGGKS